MAKMAIKDFIDRSRVTHGTEYDYSKAIYINSESKIEIICKAHGSFWQGARKHYSRGDGCPKCKNSLTSLRKRDTTESFVRKAQAIHNDLYDYSLVEYSTTSIPINILCEQHGSFEQKPNDHLQGKGCPQCCEITTEIFIGRSKKVHNDKYDYAITNYLSSLKKLWITCPSHGEFYQLPSEHLRGRGCKTCSFELAVGGINITTLERSRELSAKASKVYTAKLYDPLTVEVFSKVGITTKENPEDRFKNIRPYKIQSLEVIFEGTLEDSFDLEQLIISEIKDSGIQYKPQLPFGGYTECFKIN